MYGQGSSSLLIFTVPPTITPPAGLHLGTQTYGTLNSSYSIKGSSIVQVIPSCTNGSLTILATKQVSGLADSNPSQLAEPNLKTSMLYMYNVKIERPVVEFEKIEDSELQENNPIMLDVFYHEYPDYRQKRYRITFTNFKTEGSFWLYVTAGIVGLTLICIFFLCIAKFKKAMKKAPEAVATNNASLVGFHPPNDTWQMGGPNKFTGATLPEPNSQNSTIRGVREKLMNSA